VGVLDLIEDEQALFGNVARIVRPGGHLVVVVNHPVATAPGSEPLVDPDGEPVRLVGVNIPSMEWTDEVDEQVVPLRHRPLGQLLTGAAAEGWELDSMVERGPSPATLARHPAYRGQEQIPTLLGLRWTRADRRHSV